MTHIQVKTDNSEYLRIFDIDKELSEVIDSCLDDQNNPRHPIVLMTVSPEPIVYD